MTVAVVAVSAAGGAVVAVLALAGWARLRYTRRLSMFRCRIGPSSSHWRRGALWGLRRRRAAWVGGLLLVPSGFLHLFLTPVAIGIPRGATTRPLDPDRARGLGLHPVAVRLTTQGGAPLEIAVAQSDAEDVVGPFLAASLPGLPPAPRDQGG